MCAKRKDLLSHDEGRHAEPSVQSAQAAPSALSSDAELRKGHRARLRQRFLADPSALLDYEVLELLLGHIYLRRDNKVLA